MERANSEVNDAGSDPGAVVARTADVAGKTVEAGVREAQIGLLLVGKQGFSPFGLT
jgi:hypothetical protein